MEAHTVTEDLASTHESYRNKMMRLSVITVGQGDGNVGWFGYVVTRTSV